jgi:hypothetical protein
MNTAIKKRLPPDKQVAVVYRRWMEEHPNQTRRLRIAAFDRINDEVKGKNR